MKALCDMIVQSDKERHSWLNGKGEVQRPHLSFRRLTTNERHYSKRNPNNS